MASKFMLTSFLSLAKLTKMNSRKKDGEKVKTTVEEHQSSFRSLGDSSFTNTGEPAGIRGYLDPTDWTNPLFQGTPDHFGALSGATGSLASVGQLGWLIRAKKKTVILFHTTMIQLI